MWPRLRHWLTREPVRTRIYAALVPIVGLLGYRGLVDDAEGILWLALAAAALGVTGVETARAHVTPTRQALPRRRPEEGP